MKLAMKSVAMPSRGKALALTLLLLGFLLVFFLFFLPIMHMEKSVDEDIALQRARLARLLAKGGEEESLSRQIHELEAQWKESDAYLPQASAQLAAAHLQETIRRIVEKEGGEISSTRVETPEKHGKIRAIRLTYTILVDAQGLSRILYRIEHLRPYLIVPSLTVRNRWGTRPDVESGDPRLFVQLTVEGWQRSDPA